MNQVYFRENQRFKELAFYALLWIIQILFFVLMTIQVIFHKPIGINHSSDTILIAINLVILAINLLIISLNLKTEVTDSGISIKYTPYHLKERMTLWSEIKEIRVVRYDGIKEYYGYGLSYSHKRGWCYTISGTTGIRLYLKNGKTLLIGTHDGMEFLNTIRELQAKNLIPKELVINN